LSFADPDRPRGTQFLGACIVEAMHFVEAIKIAHVLGINPGGEVKSQGWEFDDPAKIEFIRERANKLMSRQECADFDAAYKERFK
jgi:hypothetical protein